MRNVTLLTQALFAKHGETFAPVALPHTWTARTAALTTGAVWAPMKSICPIPPRE